MKEPKGLGGQNKTSTLFIEKNIRGFQTQGNKPNGVNTRELSEKGVRGLVEIANRYRLKGKWGKFTSG